MKSQAKIRFGILCNSLQFPEWQARIIRKLLATEDVELALCIRRDNTKGNQQKESTFRHRIWNVYQKKRVVKKSKAKRQVDLTEVLQDVPAIICTPFRNELQREELDTADVGLIKGYDLDFLLKFGFDQLAGSILTSTRYGVWAFTHEEVELEQETPPFFWPVYHSELVTTTSLVQLGQDGKANRILKEGFLKTNYTYSKNLDHVLFELTAWPLKACIDIQYNQADTWQEIKPIRATQQQGRPSNSQMLQFFGTNVMTFAKKAYKSLFYTDYWNIGLVKAPIQAFLKPNELPPVHWFKELPKSKFIADPFAMHHGDKTHIIYEEYPFKDGIGKISALEFENDQYTDAGALIEEPFHMSYPFLLEYEDEIYCIPETYQAGQVRLYRATDFPMQWKFEKVLIEDYEGIDNTLIFHNDYWYLFSTDKKEGVHHNLKIHYADTPFGNWQPHPKNPVKTDIRSARPAGNLFYKDGFLYRPSMDYSEKVEGRIIINQIEKLSPTDFKEVNYCTIDPFTDTYFSDKTHTLGAAGPYTIIDGAKELFVLTNIHALKFKVQSLFRKLLLKTLKR